jgi:heme exporter protein D
MIWNSLSDFVAMNGYGPYVWGSFGVTFILFVAEYLSLRQARKKNIGAEDRL